MNYYQVSVESDLQLALSPLRARIRRSVQKLPWILSEAWQPSIRGRIPVDIAVLFASLLEMKLNQNTLASLAAFGMLSMGLHANAEDPSPEVMKEGKAFYATCMACHNVDGKGLPIGNLKMAPPLAGSKFALGDPEVMALAILKGIEKDPANTAYIGIMAPLETALDDKKLAAVMTYVRNSFGNKAAPVTEEQTKGYREKFAKIKNSVKRSTLDKLLEKSEAAAKETASDAPPAAAAPPATK